MADNDPLNEIRRTTASTFELRAAEGDGPSMLAAGVAMPFNSDADIGGWFIERFEPGAFTGSLNDDDQRALVDHDYGRVLGRRSAGTLRLNQTPASLDFEIDLPDNNEGRDLSVSIDRRDITGVSIRFRPVVEEWDESGDIPIRTVKEAKLLEVSIVADPAYEATDVALRSHLKSKARKNFSAARLRKRMKLDQAERSI